MDRRQFSHAARIDERPVAATGEALQTGAMLFEVSRRHDQLDRTPHRLRGGVAEDRLGGAVPEDDAAIGGADDDHGLGDARDDRADVEPHAARSRGGARSGAPAFVVSHAPASPAHGAAGALGVPMREWGAGTLPEAATLP